MPEFLPEQAVSLEQAIAAYTRDAAYLNALDSVTGTIEVGKYADLVVLDHDLYAIAPQQLSEVKVTATLLEGDVVYGTLP
jgi:predicted amidohydrolase YtcJ